MAIDINLDSVFVLRANAENPQLLDLPTIKLNSSDTNYPSYLSQISVAVRGIPSDLAIAIQSAYKGFVSNEPIELKGGSQLLKQTPCVWSQTLPSELNGLLQVDVQYFDSDETGAPIRSMPQTIAAACRLITSPIGSEAQPVTQSVTNLTTEISSEPEFPGWIAIDYGTSNSTVTLFDTRRVPRPTSLPKEQANDLRDRLSQWLASPASKALPDVSEAAWQKFVHDTKFNSDQLLSSIAQLEISLNCQDEQFRRSAYKKLRGIYHAAFRVPPLEWQNLIPVELDRNRRSTEISSELEILHLGKPLTVLMGEQTKTHWNQALEDNDNSVQGRFHHSPKRYYGESRIWSVTQDGQTRKIGVEELVQSAWSHLLHLTDDFRQRNPGRFAEGRFDRVVVTYPTKSSPAVRRDIERLFQELGISQVQTSYDEAVSVAIFFLWREFGGDLNTGIESFKTRCHRHPSNDKKWFQNVLVLDIGGGTTDLALMRLTLEEIDPFSADEDRGAGGRYYVLTPRLLRSSGHPQLGGELITLRLLRLLKTAIADCLLTAVTQGDLECDTLKNLIPKLNENGQERFDSGSLIKRVDVENTEGDVAVQDALREVERVIPTQWENAGQQTSQRLQTFYTLWDYAEEAKLEFSRKYQQDSTHHHTFTLLESQITDVLRQLNLDFKLKDPIALQVTIDSEQFNRAIMPVIQEAIGLAKGLVMSELGEQAVANPLTQNRVDWLILSGKTCALPQVEREIYQEFSRCDYFVWNPERITFVPQYTKLATSAGACYAERLLQLKFNLEESKVLLRKGASQLFIDVKNLFYFLPCSFKLLAQSGQLPLFDAGQRLHQLDFEQEGEPLAKVRSRWLEGVQLTSIIFRQDYQGGELMQWGSFNSNRLAKEIGMSPREVQDKIRVQFEIDHKLRFKLLLCQGKAHRWLGSSLPTLDIKPAIVAARLDSIEQPLFTQGKLGVEIAVHVLESAHRLDAHHSVFQAEADYTNSFETFRYESDESTGTGIISLPLPPFPHSKKHTFYLRYPTSDEWICIGELVRPTQEPEFPCNYHVTLDNQGFLRLHVGEVPYWTASTPEGLQQDGCVYRAELELQPNQAKKERDPFCGIH